MKLRNGPFTGGVCEFPMTCTSIEGFDRRCGQSPKGHLESEEFAGAGLRFESGAMGSLHASTAQFSGALESIFLSGSLSSARLVGGKLLSSILTVKVNPSVKHQVGAVLRIQWYSPMSGTNALSLIF